MTLGLGRGQQPQPLCRAGARQVECTINGLGERAGNASLEELVMAIRTRQRRVPGGDWQYRHCPYSAHLSAGLQYHGFPGAAQYKAIVGANAFAHESGIHQDGILKIPRDLRNHEGRGCRLEHQQVDRWGSSQAVRRMCFARLGGAGYQASTAKKSSIQSLCAL